MDTHSQSTRDAFLALRCQAGDDPQAFRDLITEFERPLLYFTAKMIGDENAALDVLQQVWWRAFRRIRSLKQPSQLRAWLYGIARGISIDHLRKRSAIARQEHEYALENIESTPEPAFDDRSMEEVHRALDQLDLRLREVLVLHFLDELPLAEIAEIVGCPIGTVKSRLFHAKRQLRSILEASHD